MNETETRAELINPVVGAVGRGVVEGRRICMKFTFNKGRLVRHGKLNNLDKAFNTSCPNVAMHVENIFDEGELEEVAVCQDFLHTAGDGKKYPSKKLSANAENE